MHYFLRFPTAHGILITAICLSILINTAFSMDEERQIYTPSNEDLDTFYIFSPLNTSGFRTLTIGDNGTTLFVGAKQKIFGFNTSDIRNHVFEPVSWESSMDPSACARIPQSDGGRKCQNQIQVIQQFNETHTIICGTNSFNPENRFLVRQNIRNNFTLTEARDFHEPFCSCDLDDSVTALTVADGDDRIIVSTQKCDMKGWYPILLKSSRSANLVSTELMTGDTVQYITSFVDYENASSHALPMIYVVSVDMASEADNANPIPKTTITQVCANDVGGRDVLRNNWSSLLKLRLRCITAGDYPLEFNLVTDMVRGSDDVIYGTFVSLHDSTRLNAVCSFKLTDIQDAFRGKEYFNMETYSIVGAEEHEPHRPGMCAYDGMDPSDEEKSTSKDFSKDFMGFMRYNFLMASQVTPVFPVNDDTSTPPKRGPLFIKVGEKYTKIAVQQVTDLSGDVHDVVFVGTEKGRIDTFFCIDKNGTTETVELASYQPTTEAIISMALSQENSQLFVGTETALYQISTSNCAAYSKSCESCNPCYRCVKSRDPGCVWDFSIQECINVQDTNRTEAMQDIYHGNSVSLCPDWVYAGNSSSTRPILEFNAVLFNLVVLQYGFD